MEVRNPRISPATQRASGLVPEDHRLPDHEPAKLAMRATVNIRTANTGRLHGKVNVMRAALAETVDLPQRQSSFCLPEPGCASSNLPHMSGETVRIVSGPGKAPGVQWPDRQDRTKLKLPALWMRAPNC